MLSISVQLTLATIAAHPFMLILVQLFSDRLRNEQLKVQEELSNQRVDPGRYERHRSDQNLRPRAERAPGLRQNNQQLLGANLKLAKRAIHCFRW